MTKPIPEIVEDEWLHRRNRALQIAFAFGQTEGDHHKAWVIDEMVRALMEDEEAYQRWVAIYQEIDKETGEMMYEWETGIAP